MDPQVTATDTAHLRRAIELAERGRGRVSPNPLVGAVVVRDGQVIGEGFHAELGGLHAERAALDDCRARGEDPAGATMYVTLEPCAHQGRQPPCTDAILEAGIARVVIASDDPEREGLRPRPGILRDGGVEVAFAAGGRGERRAPAQPALPQARADRPAACDPEAGDVARRPDDDRRRATRPWISGERAATSSTAGAPNRTRSRSGSARSSPTTRCSLPALAGARQPVRVVFDSQARLPLDSQLLATLDSLARAPRHRPDADAARDRALRTPAPRSSSPTARRQPTGPPRLAELGRRDITSLFLEGGRTLAAAFADADQIDEARIFVAPVLLGGGRADARVARTGPRGGRRPRTAGRRHADSRPGLDSRAGRRRHVDHGPLQGVVRCSRG